VRDSQTRIFYKSGTIEPIQPSSAAASAAADTASVLLSPLSVWLRAVFQVQDPEAVVFWSPDGVRDALAGRGTPSSGLRRRLGSRCSPFSGGPRSCAALDQRPGCPRLRLEWREVSGGGCVPGPPAASCSSAPFDSLAGSSPRQSVKQTQVSAKIRIFTACKEIIWGPQTGRAHADWAPADQLSHATTPPPQQLQRAVLGAAKGCRRKIPCCHTLEDGALRSTTPVL